jgi:hypothetical protein
MERNFYKRHNELFFKGKNGILLRDIRSNGGTEMKKGDGITFGIKSGRGGFYVTNNKGETIVGVQPESVDLIQ